MGSTQSRRAALRKLLLAAGSGSQAELRAALETRGFPSTQSTVSRDLKLLGAQRRLREDGSFVYEIPGQGRTRFPSEMVLRIDHNEGLVVVRTRIGRAPAVGIEIDAVHHPQVLGTIAGDDTVIVIPKTQRKTAELARRLHELCELTLPDSPEDLARTRKKDER